MAATRQPFDGSFNQYDFLTVALLAQAQGGGDAVGVVSACKAISPGKLYLLPGLIPGTLSTIVFNADAGFNLVSVLGTASVTQLIGELLGSNLIPFDNVPGRVSAFFALDAGLVASAVFSACDPSKPTVFLGHSLGGATAQVLASYAANTLGRSVRGVYTIGSPAPGDATFAGTQGYPQSRLVNAGDIVPSIPTNVPGLALVTGLASPPADWGSYVQSGQAMTQSASGVWTAGATQMTPEQIVAAVVAGQLGDHDAAVYYQRGRVGLPTKAGLQPFTNGYEKPWRLFGLAVPPPPPGYVTTAPISVPASYTNQVLLYSLSRLGKVSLLATIPDHPPCGWTPAVAGAASALPCCPNSVPSTSACADGS